MASETESNPSEVVTDQMGGEGKGSSIVEYEIDDKPPLGEAVPLGLQHLLAMFVSTIAIPLIIAGGIGLSQSQTTTVVQMALFVAGIATIVQVYSIGPVGARLPIVMGTSSIFIPVLIDVGNSFSLAAIIGAIIIAGPVEIVLGYFYDEVRSLFPPVVTGVVIMLVGLAVVPIGIDYAAGGAGAENYGNLTFVGLAGAVFLISILFNQFFDGFLSYASVLIGVVVGYVISAPLGLLDFSNVASASWVAVPVPFSFGVEFQLSAIVLVAFAYVITAMETIGDVEGTAGAVGRTATPDEMSGGLIADGVMSMFAGVFNAFPNTSFSQNVGLIGFTGVASRFVVAICGGFLVILGLFPKLAAILAAMPDPVLGGAAIVLFGMIISIGIRIIGENVEMTRRNLSIIAVSIVLGLGVEWRPNAISGFPEDLQVLLGSGILVGGLSALVLNAVFPGDGGLTSTQETGSE